MGGWKSQRKKGGEGAVKTNGLRFSCLLTCWSKELGQIGCCEACRKVSVYICWWEGELKVMSRTWLSSSSACGNVCCAFSDCEVKLKVFSMSELDVRPAAIGPLESAPVISWNKASSFSDTGSFWHVFCSNKEIMDHTSCICFILGFLIKLKKRELALSGQISWILLISGWMAQYEWGSVKTASREGTFSSQTHIIFERAWKNYAIKPNRLWKQSLRYGLDSFHPQHSVRLAVWCQLKLCSSVPSLERSLQCQINNPWSNGAELYKNLYVLIPNMVLLTAKTVSDQRSRQAPRFVRAWMWCVPCTYCDRGMFLFLQSDQQLDCALDLMRRLPPQQIEKNLSDLIDLVSGGCSGQVTAGSWV